MNEFELRNLAISIGIRLVPMLFCLVGILLAIVRWKLHPKASLLVLLALLLSLFLTCSGGLVFPFLYRIVVFELDLGRDAYPWINAIVLFFLFSFSTVSLALLVWAAFSSPRRDSYSDYR